MKIHVWCPGAYDADGGIEAYSAAVVRALAEIGTAEVTAIAKHDRIERMRRGVPAGVRAWSTGNVPLRMRTAAFAALLFARAMIERPDLIITTHLNFSPIAAWLKRRFGIGYWVSLHGVEAWNLRHASRVSGLRNADVLLPVSGYTRDRVVREQGIDAQHIRVVPDTFEPEAWQVGPKPQYLVDRYALQPETALILTVGRLSAAEAYKGHDRVLRVLKEIATRARNSEGGSPEGREQEQTSNVERRTSNAERRRLRYLIVGDGDDRPRLERIAQEEGVADLVTFAGRVPAEELADHYRLCDVFAMPSTGEGFGIVFLEALGCGKPVIGGTRDAAVDALRGGELGVLVDPANPAELSDATSSILSKTHPHPLMFRPAALRAKAVEYFGFATFRKTLEEILSEFAPRQSQT